MNERISNQAHVVILQRYGFARSSPSDKLCLVNAACGGKASRQQRIRRSEKVIDQFRYPQGDLQTWDPACADQPISYPPLADLITESAGTVYAFAFKQGVRDALHDYGAAVAGLFSEEVLRARKRAMRGLRIRDRSSGLTYHHENSQLIPSIETEKSVELFRAAIIKSHLASRIGQETPERGQFLLGGPICNFHASSKQEINTIIEYIRRTVSEAFPTERVKVWLRGQRSEYAYQQRPMRVVSDLHWGVTGNDVPSLLPSLGRFAAANQGAVDFGFAFHGPSHGWKKPFLVWLARSNEKWLTPYFRSRLDEALRDADGDIFAKLLADTPFDENIPDEFDDARQWFFVRFKYSSWVWTLQQYGYLASMLDITDSVEQALFFTHTKVVDGRFSLIEPDSKRIIYIFVETGVSTSFYDEARVDWGSEEWSLQIPSRITAQKAACLVGSSFDSQNFYGYLAVARINLSNNGCASSLGIKDMFPAPDKDLLLQILLESRPKPEGLYY